jgi:uncharacterized protein with GYD domain
MAGIGSSSEHAGGRGYHDDEADAYFFMMKKTKQWAQRTEAEIRQSQGRVTEAVRREGGKCELYATSGDYDFLSKVTGISRASALKLRNAIDAGGTVTATMLVAVASSKPLEMVASYRELETVG